MIARAAIAAVLVALVIHGAGPAALAARFSARTLPAIGLGAALLVLSQLVAAARWRILIGPGAPRWVVLAHLYLVGAFFSLFLPSAVGGDAFRATLVARASDRPEAAVVSVVLDRAFGVAALLTYAAIGLWLDPTGARALGAQVASAFDPSRWLLLGGLLLTGIGVAGFAARRIPRLRAIPAAIAEAVRATAARGRAAVACYGLSLVVQGLIILLWMSVAHGVGLTLAPGRFLVGVPLVSLATMLPLSLAGLGVREWAWVWYLAPFGVPAGDAVALSLAYFGCPLLAGLVGGALFTWRGAAPGLGAPAGPAPDRAAAAGPGPATG